MFTLRFTNVPNPSRDFATAEEAIAAGKDAFFEFSVWQGDRMLYTCCHLPTDHHQPGAKPMKNDPTRMLDGLAMDAIRTIQTHAGVLYTDEIHYRSPDRLDPSNLGEIENALMQLRKICGEAAAARPRSAMLARSMDEPNVPPALSGRLGSGQRVF